MWCKWWMRRHENMERKFRNLKISKCFIESFWIQNINICVTCDWYTINNSIGSISARANNWSQYVQVNCTWNVSMFFFANTNFAVKTRRFCSYLLRHTDSWIVTICSAQKLEGQASLLFPILWSLIKSCPPEAALGLTLAKLVAPRAIRRGVNH